MMEFTLPKLTPAQYDCLIDMLRSAAETREECALLSYLLLNTEKQE